MRSINVYREWRSDYQLVGTLSFEGDAVRFRYDGAYVALPEAAPLSASLPLPACSGEGASSGCDPRREGASSAAFFDGLLPEERMRVLFERELEGGARGSGALLASLNNESTGALVFGLDAEELKVSRSYESVPDGFFERFAQNPRAISVSSGMRSRLSLAGAQSKIGLHRVEAGGCDAAWLLPRGSAPSTVIVKAPPADFPGVSDVSVNEALCLETARQLGFDVPHVRLVPAGGGEPLIAIDRFDRRPGDPFPVRLHQEDFCQALGFPSSDRWKYEPTDGRYLSLCGRLIDRTSSNPFGDRMLFFQCVLFDYVVGNCDNHLKNHSFTWSADWESRMLSPVYDVTCTTIYERLDREMGVALCASGRIDDVDAEDIAEAAASIGVPSRLCRSFCDELRDGFAGALDRALESLAAASQGEARIVDDLERMACRIRADAAPRLRAMA